MDIHKDCYSAIDLPDKTVPTGGRQTKCRPIGENAELVGGFRVARRAGERDRRVELP